MIRACSIFLFFFFMSAAVSPCSAQSAGPLSGARLSIFGLGPIRLGMSIAEVERASGLAFRGAAEQSGQSCYLVQPPSPSDLIFLLVKNGRVAGVSVLSDAHTTMSGVRNGDSKSKVMATYGARLTEVTGVGLIYTPKDPSESQYRMVFTLLEEKGYVTSINAVKLPDGDSGLKGDIIGGCRNHVGAARQLSSTTSVQLRDGGMVLGNMLLSPNLKYIVSTFLYEIWPNDPSLRGRIRAWDATTGARIADWQAHKATMQSLALSPRGDLLASSASDRSVTVWRLPEGRQIASWVDPTETIQSLSFDGSGTILVGSGSEAVRIWNAATGSLRSSIAKNVGATVVSPNGSLIASASALLEVRSGRVVRSNELLDYRGGECIAFSPDGRYVAFCGGSSIYLRDVSSWRIVWKFDRADRIIGFTELAFHPNGQHLAVTSPYHSIWLLDLRTGEPVAFVPRPQNNTSFAALGFAPSDNALVAFNFNGIQLDRWPLGNAISSASASSALGLPGQSVATANPVLGPTAQTTPALPPSMQPPPAGNFAVTVHCRYPTSTSARVDIRWTSSIGASSYEVFRDNVQISPTLAPDTRRYSDDNAPRGKRSTYAVRALSGQRTTSGNATLAGLPSTQRVGSVNVNGDSEVYCFTDADMEKATQYVPYAIFSNNVYIDKPQLQLPASLGKWESLPQWTSEQTGFFAQAYIERAASLVVVAFRGTDPGLLDWYKGNVPANSPQYAQAVAFADDVLKARSLGVTKVIFTGHSLGGGLAQYAARKYIERRVPMVQAIVFDSSPRTGGLSTPEGTIFISAAGEILEYLSFGSRPGGLSLDFLSGGPIDRHNITNLACGLTYAAAARDEKNWGPVSKQCDNLSAVRWWVN